MINLKHRPPPEHLERIARNRFSYPGEIGDPTWDTWEHFAQPIDELRKQLNILPRGREPEYLVFDD